MTSPWNVSRSTSSWPRVGTVIEAGYRRLLPDVARSPFAGDRRRQVDPARCRRRLEHEDVAVLVGCALHSPVRQPDGRRAAPRPPTEALVEVVRTRAECAELV